MAKDPGRERRLASALRENLKRRKAQARGRAGMPESEEPGRDDAARKVAPSRVRLSPQSDGEGG
ncbi:MAG TPA: hypothetical protein VFB45_04750 [Pseudolabrys sp.]|nr:hypothetical protein [Pseudolabrys sp.]